MNFCGKQSLIGVHVAYTGDETLVEKNGLNRRLAFVQPLS